MNIKAYIASGILEEYVLDIVPIKERETITQLIQKHPELKAEVLKIEESLKIYADQFAVTPPTELKTDIFSAIEIEEKKQTPPPLNENSKITDYTLWLQKIAAPKEFGELHMEVINESPEATMVISWIKTGEKDHTHHEYTEKFLIVEGSCTAIIGDVTKDYKAGDYVEFPVNIPHAYTVTSETPMKVVACLYRKAS